MPGRSLLLLNPAASRLRDPVRRGRLVAAVRAAAHLGGPALEVVEASDPADLVAAAQAGLAANAERIVVAGGDGTVVAVVAALAGSEIPIAVLPGGTGNILAGSVGIRGPMERVPDLLRRSRVRSIDVGTARWGAGDDAAASRGEARSSRLFGVGAGIGFDARVMAATTADHKRRLGRLSYFAVAVPHGLAIRNVACRLTVDGQTFETEAAVVLVVNCGELVPGRLRPLRPIVPDDGLLDVIVVRAGNPLAGIHGVIAALAKPMSTGGPGGPAWRTLAREVHIETAVPEPVQVDGDAVGEGPLTAGLLPAPALILVPDRG
jgi:diacylglycerol kinase family enzyme